MVVPCLPVCKSFLAPQPLEGTFTPATWVQIPWGTSWFFPTPHESLVCRKVSASLRSDQDIEPGPRAFRMVPRSWGVKETLPFAVTTALARHASSCLFIPPIFSSDEIELVGACFSLRETAADWGFLTEELVSTFVSAVSRNPGRS